MLDALGHGQWDVLLLDIHMPDRGGLDILAHVRSEHPQVRVLIISALPEQQYAPTVLRAGASGFLSKGSAPEEISKAVHTVLNGRCYVSCALAEWIAAQLGHQNDKPIHSRLSARELHVFVKLAAGTKATDIGAELRLSIKTISSYRCRIMKKLGFRSNAQVTGYAVSNGLIQ